MLRRRIALLAGITGVFALSLVQQAQGVVVNAALGGKPAIQSPTGFGGNAERANDGNTNGNYGANSVTHTDGGTNTPFWQVDLGATMRVQDVTIFNRTDCCSGRLSDIVVTLLAADGVTVVNTSPEFNNNNGGNTDQHVGPATISFNTPGDPLARFVRVTRNGASIFGNPGIAGDVGEDNFLSLAEVQVFADNVAQGKPATQSSEFPGFPAGNAVDGNLGNFTHTNSNDTSASLTVNLQNNLLIDSVILHNRDDCCSGRLRDLFVDVLDQFGNVVFTTPMLNPDNILGLGDLSYNSGGNQPPLFIGVDFHALTGGAVGGSSVRVRRISDGTPGDNGNVLSLGEIQVFAAPIPEPVTGLLTLGGLAMLAVRRRRVA